MSQDWRIADARLQDAEQLPSPNFNQRPLAEVSLLVIHNISLPAGEFGSPYIKQLFLNCLDCSAHPSFSDLAGVEVSAHLLIDRAGEVVQFVGFDDRAWHAGVSNFDGRENCNDFAIGIELEGCDDKPFTQAQYHSLVGITQSLIATYPKLTKARICGHSDIAPGRKTDPGPCFDWDYYLSSLDD